MIYSLGSIVAVQACTAQMVKDGVEKHVLTIMQKGYSTEEVRDPEWTILAESEIVYDESMTIRKHFSQLKDEARKNFKQYY